MKISHKIIASLVGLAVVAGIGGTTLIASANESENGPNRPSPEMREAMKEALESGDYQAWKEIISDRPIGEQITEENFARFAEAHALMKSGDREGAKAIFDELGLKPPKKHRNKMHKPRGPRMSEEERSAIKEALENNDYQAWKEIMGDRPISEKVTEEDFGRLIEAHNLKEAGDREGAKAIFDELGLKRPGPSPHFQGKE